MNRTLSERLLSSRLFRYSGMAAALFAGATVISAYMSYAAHHQAEVVLATEISNPNPGAPSEYNTDLAASGTYKSFAEMAATGGVSSGVICLIGAGMVLATEEKRETNNSINTEE